MSCWICDQRKFVCVRVYFYVSAQREGQIRIDRLKFITGRRILTHLSVYQIRFLTNPNKSLLDTNTLVHLKNIVSFLRINPKGFQFCAVCMVHLFCCFPPIHTHPRSSSERDRILSINTAAPGMPRIQPGIYLQRAHPLHTHTHTYINMYCWLDLKNPFNLTNQMTDDLQKQEVNQP